MSNDNSTPDYELFTTDDGSPTLSLFRGEKMHSLGGAFSETQYIYGPCVERALEQKKPHILSMGLGLGYNEIMAQAQFINAGIKDFYILSFERVAFLTEQFSNWCLTGRSELNICYNEILQRTAKHYQVPQESLKESLKHSLENQKIQIKGALPSRSPVPEKFHSLLYDAFCSETNSDLWEEEHFINFLDEYAHSDSCCFSTYAATGKLKRALKARGFTLEKKSGYGSKRESTFALRIRT